MNGELEPNTNFALQTWKSRTGEWLTIRTTGTLGELKARADERTKTLHDRHRIISYHPTFKIYYETKSNKEENRIAKS